MSLDWTGLIIGAATFLIIGAFHPIVIKCEYHLGARVWPAFLIMGLASGGASLLVDGHVLSAILGVLSFVLLWCIRELKEQARRVERGWFPKKPGRERS